jgi:hypothetical protein
MLDGEESGMALSEVALSAASRRVRFVADDILSGGEFVAVWKATVSNPESSIDSLCINPRIKISSARPCRNACPVSTLAGIMLWIRAYECAYTYLILVVLTHLSLLSSHLRRLEEKKGVKQGVGPWLEKVVSRLESHSRSDVVSAIGQ